MWFPPSFLFATFPKLYVLHSGHQRAQGEHMITSYTELQDKLPVFQSVGHYGYQFGVF